MTETQTILYEGMFLFPPSASTDPGSAMDQLRDILGRAEAEVLVLRKWDDRRLAYSIRGQRRGTYLLSYFYARPAQIANIQRDVTLSEQVIRALILRADHVGETELDLERKDGEAELEANLKRDHANDTNAERPKSEPEVTAAAVEVPAEKPTEPSDSPGSQA